MNGPAPAPAEQQGDEGDTELAKMRLQHKLDELKAGNAHQRELSKLRAEHRDLLESNRKTADASLTEETAKIDRQLGADRVKAKAAAEDKLHEMFHQKIADVAIAGVDRARDSAKFVQTAATAIFAVYTGLLALVYSVTDNPLPLRGAWAGVFLGLSIAFATAYLAFLTNIPPVKMEIPPGGPVSRAYARTAGLTEWIRATIHRRSYATRAAVLSLLFGVLFIAAPFVTTTTAPDPVPAPVAPSPPAEVDDAFEEPAVRLFESQIEDYENAVAARSAALAAAKEAAVHRSDEEKGLDEAVSLAAVAALLLVILGPVLFAGAEWAVLAAKRRVAARSRRAAGVAA